MPLLDNGRIERDKSGTISKVKVADDFIVLGLVTFAPYAQAALNLDETGEKRRSETDASADKLMGQRVRLFTKTRKGIVERDQTTVLLSVCKDRAIGLITLLAQDKNIEYVTFADVRSGSSNNNPFKIEDPHDKKQQIETLMKKLAHQRLKDQVRTSRDDNSEYFKIYLILYFRWRGWRNRPVDYCQRI